MYNDRQLKILELIESETIQTQEELVSRLLSMGFLVTQATVSRDIKILGLIKVSAAGGQKYSKGTKTPLSAKFSEILSGGILKISESGQAVIIDVADGCGKLVKHSLKKMFAEDLACVADDDTVFLLFSDGYRASAAAKKIKEYF